MLASQPRVYTEDADDQQYQNPAPIPRQEPIPGGVWDLELSWDRKRGYMRLIIPGLPDGRNRWYFKEFLGRCQMLGADNERGRLMLRGLARIEDETLTLYRDPKAPPHPFADGGVRREKTLNRLCYRRMDSQWRLRDEKAEWNAQGALVVVSGMVGDMVCLKSRNDQVAHVFHDGFVVVKDGLAHLYENGSYPSVVA